MYSLRVQFESTFCEYSLKEDFESKLIVPRARADGGMAIGLVMNVIPGPHIFPCQRVNEFD